MSKASTDESSIPGSTLMRWLKRLMIGFVLALCLIIAAGFGLKLWVVQWSHSPMVEFETQDIVVKRGDNATKVLGQLMTQGSVNRTWPFKALFVLSPKLANLKVGHYQVDAKSTPLQLLAILSSGVEKQFAITFIEGSTFDQWLDILDNHANIDFDMSRVNDYIQTFTPSAVNESKYKFARVEGQFFPETYHFSANTQAIDILKRANNTLNTKLNSLWNERSQGLPIQSKEEALILASIIEKETGVASERPDIASAFVNRMNKRMRLQTDPTVIYGMADVYDGDITYQHMRDKNAYNTYVIKGLPPTPIAMVSEGAIYAALNPATTPYFYFVASGDGGHVFSTNLRDHQAATKRYLRKLKQQ